MSRKVIFLGVLLFSFVLSIAQDNDPDAKGVDPSNTDANKGIVNNYYEVWQPMMEKMKELNSQVYSLSSYFDKN